MMTQPPQVTVISGVKEALIRLGEQFSVPLYKLLEVRGEYYPRPPAKTSVIGIFQLPNILGRDAEPLLTDINY
ncbi:MAG: hypothetical protein MR890_08510 [Akkermansia muciniphila]|nr:hypothetical protein [Akkermansia muciniphila]